MTDDFESVFGAADPNSFRWKEGLAKTEAGTPRKNLHNACVALRDHPAVRGKIAYDEFRGATWVRDALPWDQRADRPWSDFDDLAATEWLQSPEVGILVSSAIAREAVQRVSYENRLHPVLEWLEGLKWDGTERLNGWLTTYLGVPRTVLTDAIGRKILISAVARVFRPGCKADHMLIIEGPQGMLKSTALQALTGSDWFADQIADLGTKDSCQDLRGKWIIELSELSAIRPGEVERVKAYVSRQVDHYRPSYGRRSVDVPRQNIFIGTTNDEEYLSDPTGGRRYWPVFCTNLNIDAITRDREQLWAEAVAAYHASESWWLDDNELREAARDEQEQRRVRDPWEEIITDWIDDPKEQPNRDGIRAPLQLECGEDGKERLTVGQILEHAIAKPAERQSKSDQMRVGKILKLFGWSKEHCRTGNRWIAPNKGGHTESGDSAPNGGHSGEVVTQGGHQKNRRPSHVQDAVNTVTTSSAHARVTPCGLESQNPCRGGQGGHANGATDGRSRLGSCAYCFDAAYADDAGKLNGGGFLHYRCTAAWARGQDQ